MPGLAELEEALDRFSAATSPLDAAWEELTHRGLLRASLLGATRERTGEESFDQLDRCWRQMIPPQAREKIGAFYRTRQQLLAPRTSGQTDSDRLWRNAALLLASAGAALSAKRSVEQGKTHAALFLWWQRAAELLADSTAEREPRPPSPGADAAEFCLRFAEHMRAHGWNSPWTLLWTLYWIGGMPAPEGGVLVPTAAYCSGRGLLFHLELYPSRTPGHALIEHPDMALRPLGTALLETIRGAADRWPYSLCWNLAAPSLSLAESLSFDGASLQAAAHAGFALLAEGKLHHPRRLILATVDTVSGRLSAVGHEREKLEAAAGAGIEMACVAPDTALTGTEIRTLSRRIVIRPVERFREAVGLAAQSAPVRYLL